MEIKINLGDFSTQEVDTIVAGLAELPAKRTYDLIFKIRSSAFEQMKAQKGVKTEQPAKEPKKAKASKTE